MGELNLLPIEIKDIHKKRRNRILAGMVVFAVIAGFVVAMIIPKIIITRLEMKESELKKEVDLQRFITEENTRLNNKIKDYEGYFSLIDAIRADNEKVTFRLKEVSEQLPPDVTVTTLGLTKNGISIAATSKNYTAICNFVANLQTSKKYSKVQLIGINSDNSSTPKYTCTISIVK